MFESHLFIVNNSFIAESQLWCHIILSILMMSKLANLWPTNEMNSSMMLTKWLCKQWISPQIYKKKLLLLEQHLSINIVTMQVFFIKYFLSSFLLSSLITDKFLHLPISIMCRPSPRSYRPIRSELCRASGLNGMHQASWHLGLLLLYLLASMHPHRKCNLGGGRQRLFHYLVHHTTGDVHHLRRKHCSVSDLYSGHHRGMRLYR